MKQTEKKVVINSIEATKKMLNDILATWIEQGEFTFTQETANKLSVVSGRLQGLQEVINQF